MAIRLKTLSFNSGRMASLVAFYNALGANLIAKKVKAGSESFQGSLQDLEITIYEIPQKNDRSIPSFSMCFEVSEITSVITKLKALPDVQILMDIEQLPYGKTAIVKDPDGHSVEILELWVEKDQG